MFLLDRNVKSMSGRILPANVGQTKRHPLQVVNLLLTRKTGQYIFRYRNYMNRLAKQNIMSQRAKKVVSDSRGLVDFAIGLVNLVVNLPDGQVIFFEEFE